MATGANIRLSSGVAVNLKASKSRLGGGFGARDEIIIQNIGAHGVRVKEASTNNANSVNGYTLLLQGDFLITPSTAPHIFVISNIGDGLINAQVATAAAKKAVGMG